MATNRVTSGNTKSFNRKMFDTKITRVYDRPLVYTPDKYLTVDKKLPTIGYDPAMDVDAYGGGRILAGLQTIATTILRLLYTVPGQFPDYPDMGIDVRKYLFTFEDEFTAARLRQEIIMQIPLLGSYVSDDSKFTVIKSSFNNIPVVVITLQSSIRKSNGIDEEMLMNIGITFDQFHQLVDDISFAMNGEVFHYSPSKGVYKVE